MSTGRPSPSIVVPLFALLCWGCPAVVCPDEDGDEVCDAVDVCTGDDATGDLDSDGVCNDRDLCTGDDASGDSDADGTCDDGDRCVGDDAVGDADGDGACDDTDLCQGDDATGDSDGDGVCDDSDDCVNGDAAFDADGDGVCDADDVCPAWPDNGDGTCTRQFAADTDPTRTGTLRRTDPAACPPQTPAEGPMDAAAETWTVDAVFWFTGESIRQNAYLSFDTSTLPAGATVQSAVLRIRHAGNSGPGSEVSLWGRTTQPMFGTDGLGPEDWGSEELLLDTETLLDINNRGRAEFDVFAGQINTAGPTELMIQLDDFCPFPDSDSNNWEFHGPAAVTQAPPALEITWVPK